MAQLKNVTVNKISLVSDKETPCVPKATTGYALYKTVDLTKYKKKKDKDKKKETKKTLDLLHVQMSL